jgi:hypothetical protein
MLPKKFLIIPFSKEADEPANLARAYVATNRKAEAVELF